MKRPDKDRRRDQARRVEKRPYKKPRILSREKLEAMASDCPGPPLGKQDGTCSLAFS